MLPNLQEGTELPEGGTFWLRTKTQERIHCDARWKKVQHWTPSGVVEVEQALEDWFQYGSAVAFLCRQACLTETTRYWGHEHDYRNNLMSVRWGGVVPRQVPCNRKESQSLRDGPFSGFQSSSTSKGAAGMPPSKGEGKALSDTDAKVLEGQGSGEKQAIETEGHDTDVPPSTDASRDEDGDAEDEFNDVGSEAEHDLEALADEDEFNIAPEAGDDAQPSQWESDVLCVADPFVQTKVEFASRWSLHYLMRRFRSQNLAGPIRPNVIVRFREDCQRVVMRLGMGGSLGALLWFDPRSRPPSPTPQPRVRRRQQAQEGGRGGRGRFRGRADAV